MVHDHPNGNISTHVFALVHTHHRFGRTDDKPHLQVCIGACMQHALYTPCPYTPIWTKAKLTQTRRHTLRNPTTYLLTT